MNESSYSQIIFVNFNKKKLITNQLLKFMAVYGKLFAKSLIKKVWNS